MAEALIPKFCKCGAQLYDREGFAYLGAAKVLESFCMMCGRTWPIGLQIAGMVTPPYTGKELAEIHAKAAEVAEQNARNGRASWQSGGGFHKGMKPRKTYKRRDVADCLPDPDSL